MRSEIAKKIAEETPEHVKRKVKEYSDFRMRMDKTHTILIIVGIMLKILALTIAIIILSS